VIRVALLVVAVAVCPGVRAEEPSTTTTTPPAEAARPAIEYGPDTPRGAMARFLAASRSGQYARAAEYLNLRALPPSQRARRGPELAGELETVLDRTLWVDVDKLSVDPGGDPNDGLPGFRDSLGTIETSTGPVEILIERVAQPGGAPVWNIASTTVAMIPALYDEFGWGPLAKYLPAPFFEIRFLQVRLWQWIGSSSSRRSPGWCRACSARARPHRAARAHSRGAARRRTRRARGRAAPARNRARGLRDGRPLARVRRACESHRRRRREGARDHRRDLARPPEPRRADRAARAPVRAPARRGGRFRSAGERLKVFIAVMAFIAALQNFGFNVTGLLAGLGIGGLAVALAAQKTVENLFGS
jgi:MscS family membrane protein